MRADGVIDRLRKNFYPDGEWAFLPQVANGTGAGAGRTADAIALNCWPSRGMELHGFEVKVSASDFKRELGEPGKAEAVAQFCDRWFIVTDDARVAKPEQLPPTWGLIIVDDNPRIVVPAPKLTPQPLTRVFVASILRAAQREGGISPKDHREALSERFNDGYKAGAVGVLRPGRQLDEIRWQRTALLSLEKSAEATLKDLRRTLADVKRIDPDAMVAELAALESSPAVAASDPHAASSGKLSTRDKNSSSEASQ